MLFRLHRNALQTAVHDVFRAVLDGSHPTLRALRRQLDPPFRLSFESRSTPRRLTLSLIYDANQAAAFSIGPGVSGVISDALLTDHRLPQSLPARVYIHEGVAAAVTVSSQATDVRWPRLLRLDALSFVAADGALLPRRAPDWRPLLTGAPPVSHTLPPALLALLSSATPEPRAVIFLAPFETYLLESGLLVFALQFNGIPLAVDPSDPQLPVYTFDPSDGHTELDAPSLGAWLSAIPPGA